MPGPNQKFIEELAERAASIGADPEREEDVRGVITQGAPPKQQFTRKTPFGGDEVPGAQAQTGPSQTPAPAGGGEVPPGVGTGSIPGPQDITPTIAPGQSDEGFRTPRQTGPVVDRGEPEVEIPGVPVGSGENVGGGGGPPAASSGQGGGGSGAKTPIPSVGGGSDQSQISSDDVSRALQSLAELTVPKESNPPAPPPPTGIGRASPVEPIVPPTFQQPLSLSGVGRGRR